MDNQNLKQAQPTTATPAVSNVQTQQVSRNSLLEVIDNPSVKESIVRTCGKNRDMFVSTLIEVFTQDGKLRQCDPRYVVAEALKSVTLGLPLNRQLGLAYLVPFNEAVKDADGNKVYEVDQYGNMKRYSNGAPMVKRRMVPHIVIGYKGYIQMALRTRMYRTINNGVVCEGMLKSSNFLTGNYDFSGDILSDKPIGYFAYLELTSGFVKTIYMTVDQMCHYAKLYGNGIPSNVSEEDLKRIAMLRNATGMGWMGDFESMALKTVLRRVLDTYGIITPEMTSAFSADGDFTYPTADEINAQIEGKTVISLDPPSVQTQQVQQLQAATSHTEPTRKPDVNDDPGY